MGSGEIFTPRQRRVFERFSELICPPRLAGTLLADHMAEAQRFVAVFPTHVRRLLLTSLVLFDQGARVHPAGRGRRFVDLDIEQAERYLRACATSRSPGVRNAVTLLRSVVVLSYYELPAVHASLDYHPDGYVREMAERRLRLHGEAIERGQLDELVDVPSEPA
jgi:hypothetical protein